MYNHSIKTLEKEVIDLQDEYARIVEASGFQVMKPEEAEPDIIKALVRIQTRLDDLEMGLYALEDAKKFHLSHLREG